MAAVKQPGWQDIDANDATIYISWSDTDLSFDFHCKCGARPCGGGTYCNYVKCPKCDRIYEMPLELTVKQVEKPPFNIIPKMMEE